ncbi:MAG: FAD-binding oxidoreductase [bacterium]|nr:FAD-binding oxidoreductase [bacterium]
MKNAKILSKTSLTPDMIELKLETQHLELQPGQWMFIHYLKAEAPLKRAYSVADIEHHGEISILTFLIKLLENGKGSAQLKNLAAGDEV